MAKKYTKHSPNKSKDPIQAALTLLRENYSEKNEQDAKNRKIQELFEEGFEVRDPRGTRKMGSKKLHQALWRTANRMKPLDFAIHGTGRPEWAEKLVTAGVGTVMTRGGYDGALRSKNGAFHKCLMYGDGFIHVGADDDTTIKFRPISNGNLHVDSYATAMRAESGSGSVSKCCVIFSYPHDKAVELYPELEGKDVIGEIPRQNVNEKELERTYEQEVEMDDMVEVAHFYDIVNKQYVVFAGPQAVEIKKLEGDEYPFMKDNEPYIPVIQYMCMPSSKGFYNHGIGAMIYDLAVISRRLMNMEINHIEDNVYPITLIDTPQGKAGEFFQKLKLAHEMRAVGQKGYVAMERESSDPNSAAVSANSLLTQNLVNEWQMIYDMLDRELKRMGIFLDEADRQGDPTATQVMAEEESSNAFVKQIMEYNASESRFAVELTIDMIKEFVKKSDKTSLNLTTVIEVEGEDIRADFVTMGQVKDEISKNNYFVTINARTGAIPSNILQQAQIARVLPMLQPGSKAYFRLVQQMAKLNDRDLSLDDLGAQPQQPEQATGETVGAVDLGAAIPTETDRLMLDVRNPQAQAI